MFTSEEMYYDEWARKEIENELFEEMLDNMIIENEYYAIAEYSENW